MNKGIVATLIVLCIGLGAGTVALYMLGDRQGPEIHVPTESAVYSEGQDTALLLEGVTAIDDKDGDVSVSLIVESVIPDATGTVANVVYVAKDTSNNVTKVTRKVSYTATGEAGQTDAPAADETQGQTGQTQPETAQSEPQTGTNADQQTANTDDTDDDSTNGSTGDGEAANDAKIAALPAGSPRFYLTQYELTIDRGDDLNRLEYVENIEDAKDDRDRLYRQIQVDGEVDTNTPGEYELTYYVVDSDGNRSNNAVLTVTVK